MTTVFQLITYLQQAPPEITVVMTDDDFNGEGIYVSLEYAMQDLDEEATND